MTTTPPAILSAIALLRIHTAWRDRKLSELILYEPEPAKVTEALELVIPYLLEQLNITLE